MELTIFFQCSKCGLELSATKKRSSALVFEIKECEHCKEISEREKNEKNGLYSNNKEK